MQTSTSPLDFASTCVVNCHQKESVVKISFSNHKTVVGREFNKLHPKLSIFFSLSFQWKQLRGLIYVHFIILKKIILSKLNMFSLYNQVITQYFLCLKTHGFCNLKKNKFNSIIHRIDLSVLFNGTFIINVYKNSVYYSVNKHA